MKMKRSPSFCSSSSSSSSCIDDQSPLVVNANKTNDDDYKTTNAEKSADDVQPKKPKRRVKAKKSSTNADGNSGACPKSRSSSYRGVTRHRQTGRFEAHLWDKTWNSIQKKRGKQIYLGAYDNEEDAARTYDLAALKYWGPSTILNFSVEAYGKDVEEMDKMTKEEYLATLRRRSSGFSRGVSKYRGVARHHHNGRWEARIGRVSGNKYLYLGTYDTQEEAAAAYDMAAIEYRGLNAVTNFDISNYTDKSNNNILPEVQSDLVKVQENEDVQPLNHDEINPILPLTKVQAKEANDHHQHPDLVQLSSCSTIPSEDMVMMMDPTEEHEHPWNLCLDIDDDFNCLFPLQDDIPINKASDFVGLFDEKDLDFDDDIGYMFDEYDPLQDAMSGTSECKVEGKDLPTSHSSSSLSTMASVCSNP